MALEAVLKAVRRLSLRCLWEGTSYMVFFKVYFTLLNLNWNLDLSYYLEREIWRLGYFC